MNDITCNIIYFTLILYQFMNVIKSVKIIIITLSAFSALSCATTSKAYKEIDNAVDQSNFSAAAGVIKKGQERKNPVYSEKNAILLYLDKGLLEHYAGNYEESSKDFQRAEKLIEEAYTKSISEGFLSYIVNDNTKAYPGEDFEDIYLNVFNALNYFKRGDTESALVEIRKLSASSGKLDMLARKYEYIDPKTGENLSQKTKKETGISEMPKTKAVNFSNSALARYLGALFYQAAGNTDAARIEFDQINRAYAANSDIYRGLVPRAVEEARNVPSQLARLNIISFSGLSPVKEEALITQHLPFQHPVLQIAVFKLPALERRSYNITKIEVEVEGAGKFNLELLEDMGAVIQETFNARYSNIFLKTYIRTIIKYTVADIAAIETSRQKDALAGLIIALAARAAMDGSEKADIRMSRYLPDKAYIGGINLDPGTYQVYINYYHGNRLVFRDEHKNVAVKKGGLNLIESVKLR